MIDTAAEIYFSDASRSVRFAHIGENSQGIKFIEYANDLYALVEIDHAETVPPAKKLNELHHSLVVSTAGSMQMLTRMSYSTP